MDFDELLRALEAEDTSRSGFLEVITHITGQKGAVVQPVIQQIEQDVKNIQLTPKHPITDSFIMKFLNNTQWQKHSVLTLKDVKPLLPSGVVVSRNLMSHVSVPGRALKSIDRLPISVTTRSDRLLFLVPSSTNGEFYATLIDKPTRIFASTCPEYEPETDFALCKHVLASVLSARAEIMQFAGLSDSQVQEWENSFTRVIDRIPALSRHGEEKKFVLATYLYYFMRNVLGKAKLQAGATPDKSVTNAIIRQAIKGE